MRIKVIPCEGRVVRDPKHGRVVPPEGAEVVRSSYWNRLARDGDVDIESLNSPAAPAAVADGGSDE